MSEGQGPSQWVVSMRFQITGSFHNDCAARRPPAVSVPKQEWTRVSPYSSVALAL